MADTRLDDIKSQILAVFQNGHGSSINLCYAVFELIGAAEPAEAGALLSYLAEIYGRTPSSKQVSVPHKIDEATLQGLKESYRDVVDGMLDSLIGQNLPEDQFYDRWWNTIVQNPFLSDTIAQVFALYYVVIDPRIPYFQLDSGTKMSNDEYAALQREITTQRHKVRFILKVSFSQQTEQASLVLKELDKLDARKKIAMMGYIISVLNREKLELLQRLERARQ